MNSYIVTYQFKKRQIQVGTYEGKTMSEAITDLEKAGAQVYSVILVGAF